MRCVFICLLVSFVYASNKPPVQKRHAFRTAEAIEVDGLLNEAIWKRAESYPVRYEWVPGLNLDSIVETRVQIAFDEQHLYLAFRAEDPNPKLIRSSYSDRDLSFPDDTVGFMIDTNQDGVRAYQFRVNALGIQMDAVNSDVDNSEDWAWDAIWDAATRIHEGGYDAEIAIPFSQLRYPESAEPQSWNFLFMRDFPRNLRYRFRSSYRDLKQNCFLCIFEPVDGIQPARSGMNLEITPTITARVDEQRESFPAGEFQAENDSQVGVSLRWGMNASTTLNAAVNPDFSQIEADTAQLDINERYALFFAEKRPFFLEGSDYFGTPIQAVFTRTMADPNYGLKLTGKKNAHTFGVLLSQDRINNLLLPANESTDLTSLDQKVDNQILRYRMDFNNGSSIGALYTSRDAENYKSQTYGVDAVWRISSVDTLRFQSLDSETRYSDQLIQDFQQKDKLEGNATVIRFEHSKDERYHWVRLESFSPDFRADTGFVARVDTRQVTVGTDWYFRGDEKRWYRALGFIWSNTYVRNFEGQTTDWSSQFQAQYTGPHQTLITLAGAPYYEHFQGADYDQYYLSAEIESRPNAHIYWIFRFKQSEAIDFANARQGYVQRFNPYLSWHLGTRFEGSFDYINQQMKAAGAKVFTAQLTQSRMVFHLNRRAFFRSIVQFTDIQRNPSNYIQPVEEKTQRLFTQLLFSYKLNPQSVFLAGYTDGYKGDQDVDLTQTARSIFIKLGYAWLP